MYLLAVAVLLSLLVCALAWLRALLSWVAMRYGGYRMDWNDLNWTIAIAIVATFAFILSSLSYMRLRKEEKRRRRDLYERIETTSPDGGGQK